MKISNMETALQRASTELTRTWQKQRNTSSCFLINKHLSCALKTQNRPNQWLSKLQLPNKLDNQTLKNSRGEIPIVIMKSAITNSKTPKLPKIIKIPIILNTNPSCS
jgi:hypothetical protein